VFNVLRADRPRLVSQKTREKSIKKHPLFEPQSGEFGGFSFSNASFLSEAGGVLIFGTFHQGKVQKKNTVLIFLYFFIKKKVQKKSTTPTPPFLQSHQNSDWLIFHPWSAITWDDDL